MTMTATTPDTNLVNVFRRDDWRSNKQYIVYTRIATGMPLEAAIEKYDLYHSTDTMVLSDESTTHYEAVENGGIRVQRGI